MSERMCTKPEAWLIQKLKIPPNTDQYKVVNLRFDRFCVKRTVKKIERSKKDL